VDNLQVAPDGHRVNTAQQNTDHVVSVCIGPDGYPWVAWLEGMTFVGGGANRQYGIYVRRWDGAAWQDVPGPANGAVSDVSVDDSTEGQSILHPASGVCANFSGQPQICTDDTYVYVQQTIGGFPNPFDQLVWQCDPGSAYSWTKLTLLTNSGINGGLVIAASSADVGHPYAALRTSTSPLQTTCWRWNGASWDIVDGAPISRSSPDSSSLSVIRMWVDDDGNPHVLHGPSSSGVTVGSNTAGVMYSYDGVDWTQVNLVMTSLGAPSVSSFNSGYMRAGPLYVHAADAGRCQVVFRTSSYDTSIPETRSSGFLGYLAEYDFGGQAWEPLRSDWLRGFLWTLRKDRHCCIAVGSELNKNPVQMSTRYVTLAEPEPAGNLVFAWHEEASDFPAALYSYDENCPVWWHVMNWWEDAAFGGDQDVTVKTLGDVAGNLMNVTALLRDDDDLWLIGRWWNEQTGYVWHSQAELYAGFAADRISEAGGERILPASTFSAVQTDVAWNKDTDGPTDGRQLMTTASVLGADLTGKTCTVTIRAMVKGTGNADFIVRVGTTEVGRVRVDSSVDGDTAWVEKIVSTTYSAASGTITAYGGINGGSDFALLDWVEFKPTDSAQQTLMETRVYKGTLARDVYSCCAKPQIYRLVMH